MIYILLEFCFWYFTIYAASMTVHVLKVLCGGSAVCWRHVVSSSYRTSFLNQHVCRVDRVYKVTAFGLSTRVLHVELHSGVALNNLNKSPTGK